MWYWARDIEYEKFPTRANDLVYQNNAIILIRNGGSVVNEREKTKPWLTPSLSAIKLLQDRVGLGRHD